MIITIIIAQGTLDHMAAVEATEGVTILKTGDMITAQGATTPTLLVNAQGEIIHVDIPIIIIVIAIERSTAQTPNFSPEAESRGSLISAIPGQMKGGLNFKMI